MSISAVSAALRREEVLHSESSTGSQLQLNSVFFQTIRNLQVSCCPNMWFQTTLINFYTIFFSMMSLICQGIRFMYINEILTFVTREEITNSFRCLQKTWVRCAADIRRIKSVNVVANNSNSISETSPSQNIGKTHHAK